MATQAVREPFSALLSRLELEDCLWLELPVLYETVEDEFRDTFQFSLQDMSRHRTWFSKSFNVLT